MATVLLRFASVESLSKHAEENMDVRLWDLCENAHRVIVMFLFSSLPAFI
jgi:hypothetical protein